MRAKDIRDVMTAILMDIPVERLWRGKWLHHGNTISGFIRRIARGEEFRVRDFYKAGVK